MNVMAAETQQRQNIQKKLKEMNNRLLTKHSVFDLSPCLVYVFGARRARKLRNRYHINVNSINLVSKVYLRDSRTPQLSWLSLHSMSGA